MSSYVVSTSALRAPGEDVSGGDAPGAIGLGESGAGGIVHRARERSLLCRGLPQDGTQDTEMTLMQVMPSAPDADLFEAVQADREGWQALAFERYRAAVTSLVRRQFRGQPDDVDDIVAEAFLRFLERASRVRRAESLRAYLLSITQNTVRAEIRRRTRLRRAFGARDGSVDEARSVDDPAARAALIELGGILARMGESERRAYLLRVVGDLGLDAVADALGLSRSTAQRRISAASTFLRKSAARNALLSEYV